MKNVQIFGIQSFSLHDGPGIRTTVFMKGCPLHCKWCHNPESQNPQPEIFMYHEKCIGCGMCAGVCPQGAITLKQGIAVTNKTLCIPCGTCVKCCNNVARELMGYTITLDELLEKVKKDVMFYRETGGVTISGGEPLMYPEFTKAFLEKCRQNGIHTAVETCGFASTSVIRDVLKEADLILYDLKMMNTKYHAMWTGVGNERIQKNAELVAGVLKKKMVVRIPVIEEVNATVGNMEETAEFIINQLSRDIEVHLLPYHNLGESKKVRMEVETAEDFHKPDETKLEELKHIFLKKGIHVQIGGSM